jgi:SRSO17 transposase
MVFMQPPNSTESRFSQIRAALRFAILLIRLDGGWRMAAKMEHEAQSSEARFAEYVDSLAAVLGRDDRAQPLKDYCTGLLMPGERKSVEPMAAVVAPAHVSAKHQSLLHLVGQAAWSDEAVLAKVRELVVPAIEVQGKIEAWIVDDTGFAKKGVHSVGVARQYCGRLGKTDNCQIAVTLSIANHAASLPIAYRLYLTEDWAAAKRGAKRPMFRTT